MSRVGLLGGPWLAAQGRLWRRTLLIWGAVDFPQWEDMSFMCNDFTGQSSPLKLRPMPSGRHFLLGEADPHSRGFVRCNQ